MRGRPDWRGFLIVMALIAMAWIGANATGYGDYMRGVWPLASELRECRAELAAARAKIESANDGEIARTR